MVRLYALVCLVLAIESEVTSFIPRNRPAAVTLSRFANSEKGPEFSDRVFIRVRDRIRNDIVELDVERSKLAAEIDESKDLDEVAQENLKKQAKQLDDKKKRLEQSLENFEARQQSIESSDVPQPTAAILAGSVLVAGVAGRNVLASRKIKKQEEELIELAKKTGTKAPSGPPPTSVKPAKGGGGFPIFQLGTAALIGSAIVGAGDDSALSDQGTTAKPIVQQQQTQGSTPTQQVDLPYLEAKIQQAEIQQQAQEEAAALIVQARQEAKTAESQDATRSTKVEEGTRIQEEQNAAAEAKADGDARSNAEKEKKLKEEAQAKAKAEEEAQGKADQEKKQKADEEARIKAEQEKKLKAEEEARIKVEQDKKIKAEAKAEEEARIKVEQDKIMKAEAEAKAEEEARIIAEQEKKQKAKAKDKADQEARIKAEQEKEQKAEAEAKAEAEEEARVKAEQEKKQKAEAEAKAKAEEEARVKAEQEKKQKAEAETKAKAEEEARVKAEQEKKQKAEAETKAKEEEEARVKAEQEKKQKAEAEAQAKAEQEAKLKDKADAKAKSDEQARLKAEQEEKKQKVEAESKAKAEKEARMKAELEKKQQAERESKAKADEEARAKVEQEKKQKADTDAKAKAGEEDRVKVTKTNTNSEAMATSKPDSSEATDKGEITLPQSGVVETQPKVENSNRGTPPSTSSPGVISVSPSLSIPKFDASIVSSVSEMIKGTLPSNLLDGSALKLPKVNIPELPSFSGIAKGAADVTKDTADKISKLEIPKLEMPQLPNIPSSDSMKKEVQNTMERIRSTPVPGVAAVRSMISGKLPSDFKADVGLSSIFDNNKLPTTAIALSGVGIFAAASTARSLRLYDETWGERECIAVLDEQTADSTQETAEFYTAADKAPSPFSPIKEFNKNLSVPTQTDLETLSEKQTTDSETQELPDRSTYERPRPKFGVPFSKTGATNEAVNGSSPKGSFWSFGPKGSVGGKSTADKSSPPFGDSAADSDIPDKTTAKGSPKNPFSSLFSPKTGSSSSGNKGSFGPKGATTASPFDSATASKSSFGPKGETFPKPESSSFSKGATTASPFSKEDSVASKSSFGPKGGTFPKTGSSSFSKGAFGPKGATAASPFSKEGSAASVSSFGPKGGAFPKSGSSSFSKGSFGPKGATTASPFDSATASKSSFWPKGGTFPKSGSSSFSKGSFGPKGATTASPFDSATASKSSFGPKGGTFAKSGSSSFSKGAFGPKGATTASPFSKEGSAASKSSFGPKGGIFPKTGSSSFGKSSFGPNGGMKTGSGLSSKSPFGSSGGTVTSQSSKTETANGPVNGSSIDDVSSTFETKESEINGATTASPFSKEGFPTANKSSFGPKGGTFPKTGSSSFGKSSFGPKGATTASPFSKGVAAASSKSSFGPKGGTFPKTGSSSFGKSSFGPKGATTSSPFSNGVATTSSKSSFGPKGATFPKTGSSSFSKGGFGPKGGTKIGPGTSSKSPFGSTSATAASPFSKTGTTSDPSTGKTADDGASPFKTGESSESEDAAETFRGAASFVPSNEGKSGSKEETSFAASSPFQKTKSLQQGSPKGSFGTTSLASESAEDESKPEDGVDMVQSKGKRKKKRPYYFSSAIRNGPLSMMFVQDPMPGKYVQGPSTLQADTSESEPDDQSSDEGETIWEGSAQGKGAFLPVNRGKSTVLGGSNTGVKPSFPQFANKLKSSKVSTSEKPERPIDSAVTVATATPFPKVMSRGVNSSTSPFGKTGKPTTFGGSKKGSQSSSSSAPFDTQSLQAPGETGNTPGTGIGVSSTTMPFPKLNSKGSKVSSSPFGSKQGSQSSSLPSSFNEKESAQGSSEKISNSSDENDTAATTTSFPNLNSNGTQGFKSPFGKAETLTFGASTNTGSKSSPFLDKMKSSKASSSKNMKEFESTGNKPKPGTKWSSSPFSKGFPTSNTESRKNTTGTPSATTAIRSFDTPASSAVSDSTRLNSEAVGGNSMNSLASTPLSEDPLLETEESFETSDSEKSGPSWYNSPVTLDWGKEDDVLQSVPAQPSEAVFSHNRNEQSAASFTNEPSSTSNASDSRTSETGSTDTETASGQPEMFALDPDDGDSGQWWQTREQDWGMDEEARTPLIVPTPERPKDMSKTWGPHGAVDEPVDIMTKYSSSNGEWWSRGKSDTTVTDPTFLSSESPELSQALPALDAVPEIKQPSSTDATREETESVSKKFPDTIENTAEVDLVPLTPDDPLSPQFDNDSTSTPTPAANDNKETQAKDRRKDTNLTPVSPNDPVNKIFDNDDSLKPIIGNQDGSDGSWYNSPIDSSFFSADRD